jgi:hypothetical protein
LTENKTARRLEEGTVSCPRAEEEEEEEEEIDDDDVKEPPIT